MAFDTAVSGIKASTAELGIIGNNLANSSTTGFKSSRAEFSDVYAASVLGVGANAIGKGVTLDSVSQQFTQGNISFTDNALDLAINGNGFFVMSDQGATTYTRSGQFSVDRDGYIVNGQGLRLMAFHADAGGNITGQLVEMQLNTANVSPTATTRVDMTANLDSRELPPTVPWGGPFDAFASPPTAPDPTMYNASTSVTIYDGLGNPHVMSMYYIKSATPNQWSMYTLIDGVSTSGPDTLTFNQSGQFDSSVLPVQATIAGWTPLDSSGNPTGAAAQNMTVDISPSTQFGSAFGVNSINQNGFTTGQLRGVEISDTGVMFARFTNGESRALGQVALANFSNPQGLQPLGNTSWSETFSSGPAAVSRPGTAGLGAVQSGALEDSNVEITEALVDMIVAQRNFQANAQVIQAEDAITQTVINLR